MVWMRRQRCVCFCINTGSAPVLLSIFLAGPYVNHLALSHFFVASSINLHSFSGWMITVTNLLNSLSVALSLMFVVRPLWVPFPSAVWPVLASACMSDRRHVFPNCSQSRRCAQATCDRPCNVYVHTDHASWTGIAESCSDFSRCGCAGGKGQEVPGLCSNMLHSAPCNCVAGGRVSAHAHVVSPCSLACSHLQAARRSSYTYGAAWCIKQLFLPRCCLCSSSAEPCSLRKACCAKAPQASSQCRRQHLKVYISKCRWVVNGMAMAIAALLGEWLCVRREMQEIPLGELIVSSVPLTHSSCIAYKGAHVTAIMTDSSVQPYAIKYQR